MFDYVPTFRGINNKGEKVDDKKFAERLAKSITRHEILCPWCDIKYHNSQPLSTLGDYPDELFCPHCDLEVNLQLRWMGRSHKLSVIKEK